ncbi:MAG: diguanylate cyclase, partial [Sulfurimonas sp.]
LESVGATIAFIISIVFYIKYARYGHINRFNIAAFGLLSMGIIDMFHAVVMPGELFVFLHSSAVFFGGLFLGAVWVKEFQISRENYRYIPLSVLVFSFGFALFFIVFSDYVPRIFDTDNSFSINADLLNIIGGMGFLTASFIFAKEYLKTQELQELVFVGFTMLCATAALLFVFSDLWNLEWWLWHILRLSAYIIALYFLYVEYRKEILQIEDTNKKLAVVNKTIGKYLDIVDEHVITSTTDLRGIITQVSKAFCEISGYTKEELIGQAHNIVRDPDMPSEFYAQIWKRLKSAKSWTGEIKNRKKDGSVYWVKTTITPLFDEIGNVFGYASVRQEITDKKCLEKLSITDALTELYNRRYFNEVIEEEIMRAKRDDKYFSFLMIDIDHFKQYNDTYGHQSGDMVLKKTAEVLVSYSKRTSDFVFRLGGEEFAILFSGLDEAKSLKYVQELLQNIEDLHITHKANSASPYVTVSMGLVVQKGESIDMHEELYSKADALLYKAKQSGRNRVVSGV